MLRLVSHRHRRAGRRARLASCLLLADGLLHSGLLLDEGGLGLALPELLGRRLLVLLVIVAVAIVVIILFLLVLLRVALAVFLLLALLVVVSLLGLWNADRVHPLRRSCPALVLDHQGGHALERLVRL